ncbi:hypothetical protein RCL1_008760 [Eukaryota sp. TZLM3-RCL]
MTNEPGAIAFCSLAKKVYIDKILSFKTQSRMDKGLYATHNRLPVIESAKIDNWTTNHDYLRTTIHYKRNPDVGFEMNFAEDEEFLYRMKGVSGPAIEDFVTDQIIFGNCNNVFDLYRTLFSRTPVVFNLAKSKVMFRYKIWSVYTLGDFERRVQFLAQSDQDSERCFLSTLDEGALITKMPKKFYEFGVQYPQEAQENQQEEEEVMEEL